MSLGIISLSVHIQLMSLQCDSLMSPPPPAGNLTGPQTARQTTTGRQHITTSSPSLPSASLQSTGGEGGGECRAAVAGVAVQLPGLRLRDGPRVVAAAARQEAHRRETLRLSAVHLPFRSERKRQRPHQTRPLRRCDAGECSRAVPRCCCCCCCHYQCGYLLTLCLYCCCCCP